jgi:hypothetical protein
MITDTFDFNGQPFTIVDKINSMNVQELKEFLNYCAKNQVFPTITALNNHLDNEKNNEKLLEIAASMTVESTFQLLKLAINVNDFLNNFSEYDISDPDLNNWIKENVE